MAVRTTHLSREKTGDSDERVAFHARGIKGQISSDSILKSFMGVGGGGGARENERTRSSEFGTTMSCLKLLTVSATSDTFPFPLSQHSTQD